MISFGDITKADAKELACLDKECFSLPWSENSFLNEVSNPLSHYVIARSDNKIVGYAGFWEVVDEGQITNIAVLKEYRRQKIAEKMLEELLKKAYSKKLVSLSLEVRESNVAAINLYQKFNFKTVGVRKNYYKNPTENAVLMDLVL